MLRRRTREGMTPISLRSVEVAVSLVLALTVASLVLISDPERASAADHSLSLYVNALGWWTAPGEEKNPGPSLVYTNGDRINITLTSEDGLVHGLFIDYPEDPDYRSPSTSDTITFDYIPTITGVFNYCDQLVVVNCGQWETKAAPNRAPMATIDTPTTGTSWTADRPHNITFVVSDEDGDPVDVNVTYSYGGGAGTIRDWSPATPGLNTLTWTPDFHGPDTVIHVTVRDPFTSPVSVSSPSFEVDRTTPVIASTSPARDAAQVDRGTSVSVTWSETMHPASGNPDAFAVRPAGGAWIAGTVTWSLDKRTMTFQPAVPLSPGTRYEVHVNATARDDSDPGNEFASPHEWAFTVGGAGTGNLPAPASVAAKSVDGVVEVSWSPVASPDLVGYHIYRGGSSTGPLTKLTSTPLPASGPTVYHDGSAAGGRTYVYAVTAVDAEGGESPYGLASSVAIPLYQNSPIFDPIPWAIAVVTLGIILGAVYGTVWRRKTI
jgi:hypothetical protein